MKRPSRVNCSLPAGPRWLLLLLASGLLACGPETSPGDQDAAPPDSATTQDAVAVDSGTHLTTDDDGDGFSELEGDCNDADHLIHPNAVEICDDGIDNNCNGAIDEAEPDADGDGFGPCNGDCDDNDPDINPAAVEVVDGRDNDCDGIVDADFDGDGFTVADGDCDDNDPSVNPDAVEDCWDGVDNNCNGAVDVDEPDADGDGFGPCAGDCDDTDPQVGPHMPEIPGDGIDNNCDFMVDQDIDGDGWTTQNGDCDDNDPTRHPAAVEVCNDGVDNDCNGVVDTDCLTACQLAELQRSSVGCVYYAVDTENADSSHNAMPYAVVVSNIDPSISANVEVQVRSGGAWAMVYNATVSPLSLHQFTLPDRHINGTGVNTEGAYRIVSDLPVIAYQFQPIDGVNSYSSDASLLLPQSSLDRYYYVVGWYRGVGGYPAEVVIVAAHDNTTVSVTPSLATLAGGGIPALPAGVPYTFPQTFNAGDYIQLAGSASFSGTYVEADQPVAVFSSHAADYVPIMCCADHLEEQMFGLQTWGQTYVAMRMPVRSTGGTVEANLWHILASQDNTTITFSANASVTGLPAGTTTLDAGQELELSVGGNTANPGDFVINADKPIAVMSFMTSSDTTNAPAQNAGDPAMAQMVPVEQFLDSYVILVPPNWINDALILVKPVGSSINLDGSPVPQGSFTAIDDGINPVEWEVARVSASDGVHTLIGTAPFSVMVVGWDSYDSYAYPGGLDQQVINPIY